MSKQLDPAPQDPCPHRARAAAPYLFARAPSLLSFNNHHPIRIIFKQYSLRLIAFACVLAAARKLITIASSSRRSIGWRTACAQLADGQLQRSKLLYASPCRFEINSCSGTICRFDRETNKSEQGKREGLKTEQQERGE